MTIDHPTAPPTAADPPSIGELLVTSRSFDEYLAMFDLAVDELAGRRILDCPGGAASFTVGAYEAGADAVAVDPTYAWPHDQLLAHAVAETRRGNDYVRDNPGSFVWSYFRSLDDHLRSRLASIDRFDAHRRAIPERYLVGSLPNLPLPADAFDLAVSSHLLFTYDDRLDARLHVAAARELLRVARELRVFPTLSLRRQVVSEQLAAVVAALERDGAQVEIRTSPYRFQAGGDEMLVVRR